MILALPDIRQRRDWDCGAAALEVVLAFHGVPAAGWIKSLPNPVMGTSVDTVEAVLWATLGRVCRGTMTTADLRHHTREGRPVICPVSDHGGHWVVAAGVHRGRVHFHDPLEGTRSLPLGAWEGIWHDAASGVKFDTYGIVGWA